MALESLSLLLLFSITIFLGYVGYIIFERTKIPDVIWLLLFGLIVTASGVIDIKPFIAISPFLAALALILILFDAGLNMDFYQMLRGAPRGLLLAIIGVVLSVLGTAAFGISIMNLSLPHALLLGAIVGGTSSPIVVPIVSRLGLKPDTRTTLNLESIFTDPLVIVVSITLLNLLAQTNGSTNPLSGVMSAFSIGAVVGMISGTVWLFALDKLKGKPFDYMLTLAVLFVLYVFTESSSGSGAIAALFFGLVLGNSSAFSRMLKFKKHFSVSKTLRNFQNEVSFFIRSFFFVYIGMIAVVKTEFIIYGLAISAILIVIRVAAVHISAFRMEISNYEKKIMASMAPRGLAAAVLAQLPASFGIANAEIFSNVVFVVIIATVIYTTIAVKYFAGKDEAIKKK